MLSITTMLASTIEPSARARPKMDTLFSVIPEVCIKMKHMRIDSGIWIEDDERLAHTQIEGDHHHRHDCAGECVASQVAELIGHRLATVADEPDLQIRR